MRGPKVHGSPANPECLEEIPDFKDSASCYKLKMLVNRFPLPQNSIYLLQLDRNVDLLGTFFHT